MKNEATASIERDFPGWRAWVSRRGVYWGAVRDVPVHDQDRTLIADSEAELRERLAALARRR